MIEVKSITTLGQLRKLRCENEKELSRLRQRICGNAADLLTALSPSALLASLRQKIASIMELVKVFKGL